MVKTVMTCENKKDATTERILQKTRSYLTEKGFAEVEIDGKIGFQKGNKILTTGKYIQLEINEDVIKLSGWISHLLGDEPLTGVFLLADKKVVRKAMENLIEMYKDI